MKRIFSGMQPSGRFHLGNYMGALDNWIKLQNDYECVFSIVDLHALTSSFENTSNIQKNIKEMAIDWLSAGLDPEKNIIFVQSHVPAHTELHLLLSMMTPLGWLERVPTYKDKLQQLGDMGKEINTYGFLGYPVLMTADIILYKAELVPVGEDQTAHLELAREMARRFNNLYKPVFPEPQALYSKSPTLPGIDGRKMSKSYGNEIPFGASPDELRARVRQMITDPGRIKKTDVGNPDVCIAFKFYKIFAADILEQVRSECSTATIGCVDCKKRLAERMVATLADKHAKRIELENKESYIKEVLAYGAQRANVMAAKTMQEVKEAMNLL